MEVFDKLFSKLIIGCILFTFPFLFFWWTFYLLNLNILVGVIIGIVIGIILNIFLLNKISNNFYNIKNILLILIYIFYSICIFGFFMGVPIFNILPGILAGIYIGRKSNRNKYKKKEFKHNLLITNIFSTIVLIFICICSAYIALTDKYTISNINGMFKININYFTLWIIIIFGGIFLITIQYIISTTISNRVYKGE
jgi:hypothetical protein